MPERHPMTRDAGLVLDAFLSGRGADYASARNTDRGRGAVPTTSALSRYLRRRLLTEHEVAHAATRAFGDPGAEQFVSEVFWLTYFKGYLETHPGAWTGYLVGLEDARERLDSEPGPRRAHGRAVEGRSGVEGFEDWVGQHVGDGWLHNHARMWFASIWIFTLRLPELGADLFMRHLLDGDSASNTLSWRWVAGLHTRGKHYFARAENIGRFTNGRYDPDGLDERAVSQDEPMPPRKVPLPVDDAPPAGEVALLLHRHASREPAVGRARIVRVGGLVAHAEGETEPGPGPRTRRPWWTRWPGPARISGARSGRSTRRGPTDRRLGRGRRIPASRRRSGCA